MDPSSIALIVSTVIAFLSELLALTPGIPVNGVVQGIWLGFVSAIKRLPTPAAPAPSTPPPPNYGT